MPHWIAIAPDHRRVVVTGYEGMKHRVMIARFDRATGQLALDERFREDGATEPGFHTDNKTWPHGGTAKGIPHGAVFGPALPFHDLESLRAGSRTVADAEGE